MAILLKCVQCNHTQWWDGCLQNTTKNVNTTQTKHKNNVQFIEQNPNKSILVTATVDALQQLDWRWREAIHMLRAEPAIPRNEWLTKLSPGSLATACVPLNPSQRHQFNLPKWTDSLISKNTYTFLVVSTHADASKYFHVTFALTSIPLGIIRSFLFPEYNTKKLLLP